MSLTHTSHIWVDGRLQAWNDVTVPLVTHALHYGSSAFEGVRVYDTAQGPAVFRLHDHLERLLYSAKTLGMTVPYTVAQLEVAVVELVRATGLTSGYVRPIITYGEDHMSLLPTPYTPVHVYIVCWPWPALLGDRPLRVTVSSIRRIPASSSDPHAKLGGLYVTSILATQDAKKRNYDEAVLLDQAGFIAEGPGENIFFVKHNTLYTPAEGSLLPGITRATVFQLAQDVGIATYEIHWRSDDLVDIAEAFFTGTAAEVAPIAQIDDYSCKERYGPITQILREHYLAIVHGLDPQYQQWLTYINN